MKKKKSYNLKELQNDYTVVQARLIANRARLLRLPSAYAPDIISLINEDSCRAYRIQAMIDNIKSKRKPRGTSIHEYKPNN